ncbi:cupin domain-containing protein [Ferrimonas balearica]|nr:cupin domain-containing protein [Ferrimonas balearica]
MPKLEYHRRILPVSAPTVAPGATAYSRGVVKRNYALVPPDGVLPSRLPDYRDTTVNFLAAPQMGARFAQTMLLIEPGGGTIAPRNDGNQHFLLLREGQLRLKIDGLDEVVLEDGGFAYVPAGLGFEVTNDTGETARLLEFYKPYEALPGVDTPAPIISSLDATPVENFSGQEGRGWQCLLPRGDMAFDMEMNVLALAPGTHFPSVETHIMEHALFMLRGGGMYMLDWDWHEVWTEDFIWMGPWVPQQFYAGGWEESAYLLYKDVNRDVRFD